MATITALTTGAQTATGTGALTPTAGVDISGMTGDFTVCIEVLGMTAGKTARIQLEDTVNAFTASAALWVDDITGQIGEGGTAWTAGDYVPATFKRSIKKADIPNNRFGQASGKARLNVTAIDGSALVVVNAWIET